MKEMNRNKGKPGNMLRKLGRRLEKSKFKNQNLCDNSASLVLRGFLQEFS